MGDKALHQVAHNPPGLQCFHEITNTWKVYPKTVLELSKNDRSDADRQSDQD